MTKTPVYSMTKQDNRRIIQLATPALLESLLSITFGTIDTIMLGHSRDSVVALSAVGLTGSIVNLVICVLMGYLVGQTASVAWYIGSNEEDKLGDLVRQCSAVNLVMGVFLSVVFSAIAPALVGFLNPSDGEVRQAAITYYGTVAAGFGFQYWMLSVSSFFRGCGKNQIPLVYTVSANFLNVIMNYLLIYGKLGFPEMGIRGAALATALSQVFGAVFSTFLLLCLKTPVRLSFHGSFRPRWSVLKRSVRIGIAGAVEAFFMQLGNVLYVKIIAKLPRLSLSANSVAQTIGGYIWGCSGALCAASTTLMGMYMGEGRGDKCLAFTRRICRMGLDVGITIAVVMSLLSKPLCALISSDGEVIALGSKVLIIYALQGIFICVHHPLGGSLKAAGDTASSMLGSFASLWIFRVGLAILFIRVFHWGLLAGWMAIFTDQLVRMVLYILLFRKGNWKKHLPS